MDTERGGYFMFKSKFLLVTLLILALAFGAVGCANTPADEQPSEEPAKEEAQEPAEEKTEEPAEKPAEDMGYANPNSLVSADELKLMLDEGTVKVVDFRDAKLPGGYIPGAVKISRGDIAAEVDGVKGMIASKEQIEKVLGEAGISNEDTVVIYDADKELWASRLWWVMKVYGHEDVRLLNGGSTAWEAAGFDTEMTAADAEATTYTAKDANESLIADLSLIKKSYENEDLVVLDTRSDKEWNDGHIPGAVHIEWTKALNEDGTYKSAAELKKLYEEAGITADKEAIMPHCKSAVRAAHTLFALQELLGYENVRNYDGSWLEYEKSGEPIEK